MDPGQSGLGVKLCGSKKIDRVNFGSDLHGYGFWTSLFGPKSLSDGMKLGTTHGSYVCKVSRLSPF